MGWLSMLSGFEDSAQRHPLSGSLPFLSPAMSFLVTVSLLAGISRSHPTCPLPCHSVTWAPTGRVRFKYVCSAAILKYKLKHCIILPCLQLNTVQQMTLCPSPSQVYVPGQITGDGWVATDPKGRCRLTRAKHGWWEGGSSAGGLGTWADLQGGAREPGEVYLSPRSIPSLKEDTINGT